MNDVKTKKKWQFVKVAAIKTVDNLFSNQQKSKKL